jgi:hypothetical protein
VQRAAVPPPSRLQPSVPAELDDIVATMLAASAERRFQSCHDLVAILEPLAHQLGGGTAQLLRFMGGLAMHKTVAAPAIEAVDGEATVLDAPRAEPANVAAPAAFDSRKVEAAAAPADEENPPTENVPTMIHASPSRSSTVRVATPVSLRTSVTAGMLVVGAAALVLAVAVSPGVMMGKALVGAPGRPAARPLPPPASAPKVRVKLTGTRGAQVSLDGRKVGLLPIELDLPHDGGTRLLEVELPGYHRYQHRIAAGFDLEWRIELKPFELDDEPQQQTWR